MIYGILHGKHISIILHSWSLYFVTYNITSEMLMRDDLKELKWGVKMCGKTISNPRYTVLLARSENELVERVRAASNKYGPHLNANKIVRAFFVKIYFLEWDKTSILCP